MKKIQYVGVTSVIIGMIISRIITKYLGGEARIMIMSLLIAMLIFSFLWLFTKKYYLVAACVVSITIPMSIGVLGAYLGNIYLLICGMILLVFITGIGASHIKRILKNEKK